MSEEAKNIDLNSHATHELLFISRGRGRGHAVPDMEIAIELRKILRDWGILFASYSIGAEYLGANGWPVIDLRLAENPTYTSVQLAIAEVIRVRRPSLVISHEEFGAIPVARIFGIPSIFIGDWFPSSGSVASDSVAAADGIVFLGDPGIFAPPPGLSRPPLYSGPIVRKMKYSRANRNEARLELGIPLESFMVSVIPGGWATEAKAPIAAKVIGAFDAIDYRFKSLFWLTGVDADIIRSFSSGEYLRVLSECKCVEQIIAASDLVITKGNRGTIAEVAYLGIPSLSLSFRNNPVDEILVGRFGSNIALNAHAVDSTTLTMYLDPVRVAKEYQNCHPHSGGRQGAERAANIIASEIRRCVDLR